ncbi:hypothetical protein LUZ60_009496 [Juncus effusus]|nr:hypothetical protein LUZ60_009496 [Juncus effusus]
MMQSNPNRSRERRRQNPNPNFRVEGPNWVLIAGGVLLSTLTVRLGCKLKQVFDKKRQNTPVKGNNKNIGSERGQGICEMHSNLHCFDSERCYFCVSGCGSDTNQASKPSLPKESPHNLNPPLPLVKVNGTESGIQIRSSRSEPRIQIPNLAETGMENGVMWSTSPDRLEPPRKPLNYSNSSGSPCFSESGSDIYSKREVISKLRVQLKRRDEMVMEMQAQISELQTSLNLEIAQNGNLGAQIEGLNRDLFENDREIRRLQKIVADCCVAGRDGSEMEGRMERKMEGLRREVGELREVIEGKDFLIQSYKEQKNELQEKIKDLQVKLAASQVPNIL